VGAILFKAAVPLITAILGAWALKSPWFMGSPSRIFVIRAVLLQQLPTLCLFVLLYVVVGQDVTSDVPAYYLPAARAVLGGQLPYRDFPTSYAPLFPYIGAAIVALWNSAKVFVLFAMLVNGIALVLWHTVAVALMKPYSARICTVLYASCGHVTVQVLLGTNQIWIAAALAGSTLLLMRDHDVKSGLVQALSLCVTKFLALLFWPILWVCAPSRTRWLLGALLLPALVFGAVALAGGDILYPFRHEGDLITSGNLPYLLGPVLHTAVVDQRFIDVTTAMALAVAVAWMIWSSRSLSPRSRPQLTFAALTLICVLFLLFSKKSFTGYAVFCLFPAIAVLVETTRRQRNAWLFLTLLNIQLAMEPSVWFHLGGNNQTLEAWLAEVGWARAGVFVFLDVTLLASYAYLAYSSIGSLRRTVAGATCESSDSHSRTACSLV
jgi:hypothetical protein